MKINYEDIIDAANKRKLALQEFDRQTGRVAELCNMVAASANIAEDLYASYMALDTEGKKMLPAEVQRLMPYLLKHEVLRQMNYHRGTANGPEYGYTALLNALGEN